MYTKWTQHLTNDEDKENFERSLISAKAVLDRLQQILEEEEAGLDRAECSPKIYDSPNWDYKQAHGNGFRGGLHFVNKLINLDHQKGTTHDRESIGRR